MGPNRRMRCAICRQLTWRWEKVNGGPACCYDGCYSTTGIDRRTADGAPKWIKEKPNDNARR